MTVIIMILAIGLGLAVEQSLPSLAFLGFARPPILALVVAYFALTHSVPMMLLAALLGGIMSDGIGALPLGITALALATVGTGLHYCRHTVFSGKPVTNIFFGAMIGISVPCIIFALLLLLSRTPYCFQISLLFLKIIGTMIYGAVFFPITYVLLKRLELITGAGRLDSFTDDTHSNN